MSPPRITKPYERDSGPWPLPNWITKSICLRAGREASAALCVALGKHTGATAAHEATYYEPFTYWDWHGLGPDDTYAREWKSQRMWEHQRGFVVDETKAYGYPTSRERWMKFRGDMEAHPWKRDWVTRIAVAHWMEMEDLYWIADNLMRLVGMDLSDIPAPYKDHRGYYKNPWEALLGDEKSVQSELMLLLLASLTWLGLPDVRDPHQHFAGDLMYGIMSRCTQLRTLSIRRVHSPVDSVEPHDYICILPIKITTAAPPTLTKLELRVPFPALDALMRILAKRKSSIKHISIDLGAWMQLPPGNDGSVKLGPTSLHGPEIKRTAGTVARAMRFTTYEKSHNEKFQAHTKWRLPRSQLDGYMSEEEGVYGEVKHAFDRNFYDKDIEPTPLPDTSMPRGSDSEGEIMWSYRCGLSDKRHEDEVARQMLDARPSTVPIMLNNIYRAVSNNPSFTISALEPEWQEKSTNPLHPFALLHKLTPEELEQTRDCEDKYLTIDHYRWLNTTFDWRPVFDWDCLVNPEASNAGNNGRTVYEAAKKQFGLESLADSEIVKDITKQFRMLKQAGIPLHILIGHRPLETSSLYWGWPHNESTWSQWLETPVNVSLHTIAPLVDTLSIIYDIRNPLDSHRLQTIESLSPGTKVHIQATCPRPVCPWTSTPSPCPFPLQWPPTSPPRSNQKMANKHLLRTSNPCLALAPHHPSLPPPGHSIPPNTQTAFEDSLTHLATDAAYKREALSWQKFWCAYAPRLTNLTELNVRMPRAFDVVKSAKLARLLDPFKGWHVVTYADEIAAEENGNGDGYRGAGVFVRRTWVKKSTRGIEKISISDEGDKIDEKEYEEFAKGVGVAKDAGKAERALEKELKVKGGKRREGDHVPIENRLESVYGRRIKHIARQAWEKRVRSYVDEFQASEGREGDGDVKIVLGKSRKRMERKMNDFRPGDVFQRNVEMKEGIGLASYPMNYEAEEDERRRWPAPVKKTDAAEPPPLEDTQKKDDMPNPILIDMPVVLPSNLPPPQPTPRESNPQDKDDWDPYGPGTTLNQQPPALNTSLAPPVDDVFKLLDVLREHGSSIVSAHASDSAGEQPRSPYQGYEAASPVGYAVQTVEVEEVDSGRGRVVEARAEAYGMGFEEDGAVGRHAMASGYGMGGEAHAYVGMPTMDTPPVALEPEDSPQAAREVSEKQVEAASRPSPNTNRKRPVPRKQAVTPKSLEERATSTRKEHTPLAKENTPPPRQATSPPKEPTPPPREPTPPPKQPTPPPKSPTPQPPTPPAPKKRAARKRKDPVILDTPPDLETGRRLRSSRSATPARSYKEVSDEEEDVGEKVEKGKGKAKVGGRKRKVDEEWEGEGQGGKGKGGGRKKGKK